MLQEDSNGEASFEIIDKRQGESSQPSDKTESSSSISSPYSMPSLPSGSNLLSGVTIPSNSDFTIWPASGVAVATPMPLPPDLLTAKLANNPAPLPANVLKDKTEFLRSISSSYSIPSPSSGGNPLTSVAAPMPLPSDLLSAEPVNSPSPLLANILPTTTQSNDLQPQYPSTQFSAAIPPNKGFPIGNAPPPDVTQSGSFMSWMKDAVNTGGILSKVAEKAKSSVDSIITTLDPQMSEFIYSGGDLEVSLVTQNMQDLAPVREAIYTVFGKAWINAGDLKMNSRKSVCVGFLEGFKTLEEHIAESLQIYKTPTIGIENILLNEFDCWFDLSVLMLCDVENRITIKSFTQATEIPVEKILNKAETEFASYSKSDSVEIILSEYLKMKPDWQLEFGISRKEILFSAIKSLLKSYKDKLSIKN